MTLDMEKKGVLYQLHSMINACSSLQYTTSGAR